MAVFYATGAMSAEILLTPFINVSEEYNNNTDFNPTDYNTLHDYITTISPGLKATDQTELLDSGLQSVFHLIRYHENSELDATDQEQSAWASYRITERWKSSAEAIYITTSLANRDIETTGLVQGTATRIHGHYGGSTDYALSEKAEVSFSYFYDNDSYESPNFVNSTTKDSTLVFRYDLSTYLPGTVAQIETGYNLFDYPDTQVVEYTCNIGARMQINELYSLNVYIGRNRDHSSFNTTYFGFEYPQTSMNRGNVGQLALSYSGEKMGWNLSLYNGINALSGEQGAVSRTAVQLDISRKFTMDLEGAVSAQYYLNKADQGQLSSENIDEQTSWIQPKLTYHFTNDFFLEAYYRYTHLRDRVSDMSYIQSLCNLSLVWRYPIKR